MSKADAPNTTNPSRRSMLALMGAGAAFVAVPAIAAMSAPAGFDAKAYVELWRKAGPGNIVGLTITRDDKFLFGFHNPTGLDFPEHADLQRWWELQKADHDWKTKVVDYLLSEENPVFV